MEEIEDFLRAFSACIVSAKMYSVTHPQSLKMADAAYGHLQHILEKKGGLVIGFVENEIIYENNVLFKISNLMETLITYSRKKGIEKLYFDPDLAKEELLNFILFLLSPGEIVDNLEEQLRLAGVWHIKGGLLTTPEEELKKKEAVLSPYENALKNLSRSYERWASEPPNIAGIEQDLKLIFLAVREQLSGKYQEFLSSDFSGSYSADVIRCLNVSILSVTAASRIGLSPQEVMSVGMASLLYNIGKFLKGADGPSGHNAFQSAKTLLKYKKHFGELPVIVAFKDSQMQGAVPHTVSMIVRICECYDDLVRLQGAKEQIREKMHQLLAKDKSKLTHPQLLERFFKIMGI